MADNNKDENLQVSRENLLDALIGVLENESESSEDLPETKSTTTTNSEGKTGGVAGVHFTPQELYDYLDKFVIGQEEAKRILSVAAFKHYMRFANDKIKNKSNVLMVGPSGTGKTYLIQKMAEFLNVPISFGDATSLTQAGYVGEDVDSLVNMLYEISGQDVDKAERGIIFIDEFDKLRRKASQDRVDVNGSGVQVNLLKLIEGTKLTLKSGGSGGARKLSNGKTYFDTKNILFICAGAFDGIEMLIKRRLESETKTTRKIGFAAEELTPSSPKHGEIPFNELRNYLKSDDVIAYGFIPEIVGRLPVIATLKDLKIKDLVDILLVDEGLIYESEQIFNTLGVNLYISYEAVCTMALLAVKRGVGARGLRSIVEDVLNDSLFELPTLLQKNKEKIDSIVVTSDVVKFQLTPYYLTDSSSLKLKPAFKENATLVKKIKKHALNAEQDSAIMTEELDRFLKEEQSQEIAEEFKSLMLTAEEERELKVAALDKFKEMQAEKKSAAEKKDDKTKDSKAKGNKAKDSKSKDAKAEDKTKDKATAKSTAKSAAKSTAKSTAKPESKKSAAKKEPAKSSSAKKSSSKAKSQSGVKTPKTKSAKKASVNKSTVGYKVK